MNAVSPRIDRLNAVSRLARQVALEQEKKRKLLEQQKLQVQAEAKAEKELKLKQEQAKLLAKLMNKKEINNNYKSVIESHPYETNS